MTTETTYKTTVNAACGHEIEVRIPWSSSMGDAEREVRMAESLNCAECAEKQDRIAEEKRAEGASR